MGNFSIPLDQDYTRGPFLWGFQAPECKHLTWKMSYSESSVTSGRTTGPPDCVCVCVCSNTDKHTNTQIPALAPGYITQHKTEMLSLPVTVAAPSYKTPVFSLSLLFLFFTLLPWGYASQSNSPPGHYFSLCPVGFHLSCKCSVSVCPHTPFFQIRWLAQATYEV